MEKEQIKLLQRIIMKKAEEYLSNNKDLCHFVKEIYAESVEMFKLIYKIEVASPVDLYETQQGRNAYKLLINTVFKNVCKSRKELKEKKKLH